ncbi:hypothetical protein ORV05_20065 [Amycolatopsis cynarae]|uniref:Lipoprotein n=1 Tax=Amycolatopsis cynarae TaxID=2995223 RepID=A0ABY7AUD6_9PSEU|nr:hypothetical protein [Amycolatopsis sp. HUAS 11-8]WAL63320.1 hypothetical protein ORV05_20065 [Amycolatopsis sp. HUAS 11-8]
MVLAAVALTGLAGCANRPNNLETYYDSTAPATDSVHASAAASSSAPVSAAAVDPAAAAREAIADEVASAVLTKDDLAKEGVHAAASRADNAACFNAVPAGDPRGSTWVYGSGASLTQLVTGYLDRPATDVLAQVQCDGTKLNIQLPPGATAVHAWCQGATCTVLLAAGHVLSGLQVTASTAARATDAVKSVTPLAAKKLPTG